MTERSPGEAFLTRWSRRKREQDLDLPRTPDEHALPANQASGLPGDAAAAAPERVLTDADMPPLESLDEASDFSGFLSQGVSDELRRMALRKLFAQPSFNVLDGLNDYDEDYTKLAPLGDTITYQMRQWMERDRKKLEDEAAQARDGEPEALAPAEASSADPGEAQDSEADAGGGPPRDPLDAPDPKG